MKAKTKSARCWHFWRRKLVEAGGRKFCYKCIANGKLNNNGLPTRIRRVK